MRITKRDIADIYHDNKLYLRRWSLWLPFGWSIKVHRIVMPDYDRCAHDHPWDFVRVILSGGYVEVRDKVEYTLLPWRPWAPWRIYPCRSSFKHRIDRLLKKESWTLALCTPKKRNWGFYTRDGWKSWREFIDTAKEFKIQWCDTGEEVVSKLYGVGINDANYITKTTLAGKTIWCPFFKTWFHMLRRCYSESAQQRNPSYLECKVCDEWLIFSNFKTWMEDQDWEDKQIDKDILGDGKLYSPYTCCFVDQATNKLLTHIKSKDSELPPGLTLSKGRIIVRCSDGNERKYLGSFDCNEKGILEAAKIYNQFKAEVISSVAEKHSNHIRNGLLKKAFEIENQI